MPGFSQWFNLVSGTADHLYAVRFSSKDTGIVVGGSLNQSTFLKTTNGGVTWHSEHLSNSKWMYALEYIGNGVFIAGGYNGVMYKTTDYGTSWSPRPSGTTQWIYDLDFPNADTGYAVGLNGLILRSTNGGDNWNMLAYQAPITLLDVHFLNASLGMAVGFDGRIFKTTNAGSTWDELNNEDNRTLTSVCMLDKDTIIACGFEGLILRSTDAGQSWNVVVSGTPNHLQDLTYTGNGVLFAVGNGSILRSSDAGITWTSMNYPVTTNLNAVDVVDVGTAYAVGMAGTIIKNDLSLINIFWDETECMIYPNPAMYDVSIIFPENVRIEEIHIMNSMGMIIERHKTSFLSKIQLSVDAYKPGVYYIQFVGEKYHGIQRFAIAR
ncbi:MAG: YCF48-related protein [Flavobacteriales bacterium]|nr:YCF48-related protein [Flavobacteriales bacterium]